MKQQRTLVKAEEEAGFDITEFGELRLPESLDDCEIGVEKEITLLVVPTKNNETGFKATVSEVVGYEEEEAGKPAPTPKPKRPPSILRNKEMAPAMENY